MSTQELYEELERFARHYGDQLTVQAGDTPSQAVNTLLVLAQHNLLAAVESVQIAAALDYPQERVVEA